MCVRLALLAASVALLVACKEAPREAAPSDARVAKETAPRVTPPRGAFHRLAVADTLVRWDADTALAGDVDCDGVVDSILVGRAASRIHVGMIRGSSDRPEILTLGIGAGRQDAVCSARARLTFESLDYDPTEETGELEGFQRSAVFKGLELGDGECDSIHMYWNRAANRLDYWRL
jgi:hypothetical protein